MTVTGAIAVVAAVLAVLCWAGAIAARRQSWSVAGSGSAALALVAEAWRRGAGARWWVLGAAVLLVVLGEGVRVAVEARRRGTHVVVAAAAVRSTAVGAAVIAGMVAVAGVAVAAWPAPSEPDAPAGGPATGTTPGAFLPLGVALLAVGVLVAALAMGRLGRRRQVARRSGPVLLATVAGLVVATTVVAAAAQARVTTQRSADAPPTGPVVVQVPADAAPDVAVPERSARPTTTSSPGGWSWWASVLVMVAFLVVLVVFGRREQLYPPEDLQPDRLVRGGLEPPAQAPTRIEAVDRATVLATVEEALVGLREDTDPRVAVRVAYTTVARGLGRQDLGRRPAETEGEYLGRVFGVLGAGQVPLRRLTELFSLARFSDEPIDETMRAEALAALEQIRLAVAGTGAGRDAGRERP